MPENEGRGRAWLLPIACAVLAACSTSHLPPDASPDGGAGDPVSCLEAPNLVQGRLHELWSDPNPCVEDADCVLSDSDVECPSGAFVGFCDRGVHAESVGAFEDALARVAADTCGRIEPHCAIGPTCPIRTAACRDGACVAVGP